MHWIWTGISFNRWIKIHSRIFGIFSNSTYKSVVTRPNTTYFTKDFCILKILIAKNSYKGSEQDISEHVPGIDIFDLWEICIWKKVSAPRENSSPPPIFDSLSIPILVWLKGVLAQKMNTQKYFGEKMSLSPSNIIFEKIIAPSSHFWCLALPHFFMLPLNCILFLITPKSLCTCDDTLEVQAAFQNLNWFSKKHKSLKTILSQLLSGRAPPLQKYTLRIKYLWFLSIFILQWWLLITSYLRVRNFEIYIKEFILKYSGNFH